MVGSRTATALVGLLASLFVTAALWWYFDSLFVFLFLPFVPFLFRGLGGESEREVRECPQCGFQTEAAEFDYCPRDGTRLERRR
ncbi:hypothetical protein [Haloarcula nitratireducens]|uniref:Small CPxCG-related zinc finger protein n=1 Tax=Haloarcula nitratireducens TaxID=2487749 RepID=A0AAW4PAN7_9EURY|nr:hypothetical protein [Halomicroarcula nitratireducens]MBX0294961.1 hypothetical protein [Halomicroarcula nitratireducens]